MYQLTLCQRLYAFIVGLRFSIDYGIISWFHVFHRSQSVERYFVILITRHSYAWMWIKCGRGLQMTSFKKLKNTAKWNLLCRFWLCKNKRFSTERTKPQTMMTKHKADKTSPTLAIHFWTSLDFQKKYYYRHKDRK